MLNADYNLRYDSLAPAFNEQLKMQLKNPITYINTFDSLSKYIKINVSADKIIKFYSWNDLTGGTWNNIKCIAQFKSQSGNIIVQQLNTEGDSIIADFTDSGVYDVYDIIIDTKKYYLTFAWGTHGNGHQHIIVQIFSILSDKLEKCKSCFEKSNDLIIEYPRATNINIEFNSKTNTITYMEFKKDEMDGIFTPTGRKINLELVNGVFLSR
jgi:hypothetical protein